MSILLTTFDKTRPLSNFERISKCGVRYTSQRQGCQWNHWLVEAGGDELTCWRGAQPMQLMSCPEIFGLLRPPISVRVDGGSMKANSPAETMLMSRNVCTSTAEAGCVSVELTQGTYNSIGCPKSLGGVLLAPYQCP